MEAISLPSEKEGQGGAIFIEYTSSNGNGDISQNSNYFTNCNFSNNHLNRTDGIGGGGGGAGGAIYFENTQNNTLAFCVFSNNSARIGGAIASIAICERI